MNELPSKLLYPDIPHESFAVDISHGNYIRIDYRETRNSFGRVCHEITPLWCARSNLRWFAVALNSSVQAALGHGNFSRTANAVLVGAGDSFSISDNGVDYAIYIRIANSRSTGTSSGNEHHYSFYISLPLAELLANELLALSASDGGEAP